MDEHQHATFITLLHTIDATVVEPRDERHSLLHNLLDIVALVILGTICGAKSYEDVVQWAHGHLAWLQEFLFLDHGIPKECTLRNVFERIDSDDLEELFVELTATMALLDEALISLDGKAFRGATAKSNTGKQLMVLNAWAHDNELIIGQHLVEEGHNEISDLPALIDKLELEGAHVTIDAIGTQTAIAEQLRRKGADYTFIAKDNQPELHAQIREFFEWQMALPQVNESRVVFGHDEQWDKGHGRIEKRAVHCYDGALLNSGHIGLPRVFEFAGARTIIRLERERHLGDQVNTELHYYFSTRAGSSDQHAAFFNRAIRAHWGVENKGHWVLDVTFGEDARRLRKRTAAYNLGIIRRLALNLVRKETSLGSRVPLRTRMFRASCDPGYLAKILAVGLEPAVHDT